ncbi:hypothetical protein AAG747_26340 [Rapidithrix thailandica]|uniref:Uncharacterized protein n=1 Tax=Rapidithrix thailandica TaxID=413964 RepID=A0AAW9SGL5_9BACT
MEIKFKEEKFSDLTLNFNVSPSLFDLKINLKHQEKEIKAIHKTKNQYKIQVGPNEYLVQVKVSPFDAKITINDEKFDFGPKPKWYEYIVGGLPFLLAVSGGALGGVIGFLGWTGNMNFLRFGNNNKKYLHVALITVATIILYITAAFIIRPLFQ